MRRSLSLIAPLAVACGGADEVPPRPSEASELAAGDPTVSLAEARTETDRAGRFEFPDTIVYALLGDGQEVTAVALSPDGRRIASGSEAGTIRIWDASDPNESRVLSGHEGGVTGLTFSPDGQRLVSVSADGTTRLWDVSSGMEERVLQRGNRVSSAVFSPDGSQLATGVSADGIVRLWDPETGVETGTLHHRHHRGEITYSPDGTLLIVKTHGGAVAWRTHSREAAWETFPGCCGSAVVVDPRGPVLAFRVRDHVVLMDIASGQPLDTLFDASKGPIAFTPSGELVSASGRTVGIWDVASGREVASISGDMGEVSVMAISPDGSTLVAGSRDAAVWLWNLPKARLASARGLMPYGAWGGPLPRGVGVHCDRRYGPGGVLAGQVIDALDAQPIDSAQVVVNGCRLDSSADGSFFVLGIDPADNLRVLASKVGWVSRSATVQTRIGDTTRVTIRLPRKLGCDPAEQRTLPRIETMEATVSLRLDPSLQAALDEFAPGFTPLQLDEFSPWIVSGYTLQCHQAPSAVLGDFNGDGASDLAAFGWVGGEGLIIVLISGPDGYVVAREDWRHPITMAGLSMVYLTRAEPGVYTSPMAADPLVLTTHAIHEITGEKASVMYYYADGELRIYVTGD